MTIDRCARLGLTEDDVFIAGLHASSWDVLVGPLAVEAFSKIHCDVAIMSSGGITLEGISNSHGLLIEIQKAMIRAAQKVIFCFDHTKFGRESVLPLCGLDSVDTVVTDAAAAAELVQALRERELEVIVAPAVTEQVVG